MRAIVLDRDGVVARADHPEPVLRDGEVLYDISFSPPIEIFQARLNRAASTTESVSRRSGMVESVI